MRIVFMGTPDFAKASLAALLDAGRDVAGVFTQPDRARGRGMKLQHSPVKELALQHNLPVFQPAKMRDGTALEALRSLKPELAVVVAYGRLLPSELLAVPPLGCINVHASLLPELRGAAPIQWAVARGYTETGVTTMHMEEELDAGDIILYNAISIGSDDTAGTLHDRLRGMGAALLLRTLGRIEAGTAPRVPQDHARATFAPIIRKEDGRIDFTRPVCEVDCHIRGMHPWPCAFFGQLKVHRAAVTDEASGLPPGSVLDGGKIACGGGGVLQLLEVQGPGGRRMTIEEYLRGNRL